MKIPSIIKRKKLRAATARRARSLGLPEMDYDEMSEPNMKLSRALLIVLVLHVVAVAGIIAFNTIKAREASVPVNVNSAPVPQNSPVAVTSENAIPAPNEVTQVVAKSEVKAPAKTASAPKSVESDKESEAAKPATKSFAVADSGKIYTVVKGDNPVTIARHLHVNYDALLELNGITDPRKLQIGQKLHIPERDTPKTRPN